MHIIQFWPKITKIKVSTFWMSGKSTDSCRSPTQPSRLVSFNPFSPNNGLPNPNKSKKNMVWGASFPSGSVKSWLRDRTGFGTHDRSQGCLSHKLLLLQLLPLSHWRTGVTEASQKASPKKFKIRKLVCRSPLAHFEATPSFFFNIWFRVCTFWVQHSLLAQ